MMSKYSQYCCIELLDAIEDGFLSEVVSGIRIMNPNTTDMHDVSSIRFCPYCSAEFETLKTETGWDWKVKK
jgi:hypothetical protein